MNETDAETSLVLRAIVLDTITKAAAQPDGCASTRAHGHVVAPDGRTATCTAFAMINALLETLNAARAQGNPYAPPFPHFVGGGDMLNATFDMPGDLGALHVSDILPPGGVERTLTATWTIFAPGRTASAHRKMLCHGWAQRLLDHR